MWYVYLIREVMDGTIYVGITTNLTRRLHEHNTSKGAKFTRGRSWDYLAYVTRPNRSEATKLEIRLKRMSATEKLEFAKKIVEAT